MNEKFDNSRENDDEEFIGPIEDINKKNKRELTKQEMLDLFISSPEPNQEKERAKELLKHSLTAYNVNIICKDKNITIDKFSEKTGLSIKDIIGENPTDKDLMLIAEISPKFNKETLINPFLSNN